VYQQSNHPLYASAYDLIRIEEETVRQAKWKQAIEAAQWDAAIAKMMADPGPSKSNWVACPPHNAGTARDTRPQRRAVDPAAIGRRRRGGAVRAQIW
jgi:hypothetical protein